METTELSKLKKIKLYCQLIRYHNLLIGAAAVLVMAQLLQYSDNSLIFLCALEVMLIMALGNIHNDIVDQNIDKINHPNRVLVNKSLSFKAIDLMACSIFSLY